MANPAVQAAIDAITQATSVEASAVAFVNGVPSLINDAVAKAVQNGATEAELAPLTQLSADLQAQSAAMVAAVQANTPVTPVEFKAKK